MRKKTAKRYSALSDNVGQTLMIAEKAAHYGTPDRKVSVRFTGADAEALVALERKWHLSTSEVLQRAVVEIAASEGALRSQRRGAPTNPYEALLANGFIGAGSTEAPADLSENYKSYLTESLREKNGRG